MECKFCQHTLEEGNSVCPNCGKDNAEEVLTEEVVVEEAAQEEAVAVSSEEVSEEAPAGEAAEAVSQGTQIKEGFRMTPGKLAVAIVAAILLVALLVALVLQGMGFSLTRTEATEPSDAAVESMTVETVPATVPADGTPDDVTCKGSYSVSDEDAIAHNTAVVATMGEDTLTNGELQIYYWLQVQQFLSEYGAYASYFGLDYTQPLDTQVSTMDESGHTWQQFFLSAALNNWHNYQALSNESLAQGYVIDPEIQAELDATAEMLEETAVANGFADANAWLAYNVGAGAKVADYVKYLTLYYQGYAYFTDLYDQLVPTDAELEAYFDSHADGYADSGITKESGSFVDVRHILVMPEGADSSNIRSETFPEEAWATAKAEADAILADWRAGEATEDTFAALANEKSDDGDGVSGGLYTQVSEGDMVQAFNDWCFDESRAYGDVEIVETEYGYHIMFFVSNTPKWKYYAESDCIGEKVTETVSALAEENPMQVDYSAIKLGVVDMG